MTATDTTATTTATTAQEGTEMTDFSQTDATAPDGTNPSEGTEEGQQSTANREAANYRTKLRAAEAERDGLAGKVATYQKRDAEALVGNRLLSPAELWVGDATKLEDLLAEDGTVDKAKVDAAVAQVLADRPYLAPKRLHPDTGAGRRGGSGGGGGSTWSDVIKGRG